MRHVVNPEQQLSSGHARPEDRFFLLAQRCLIMGLHEARLIPL
jgi:hypothetical protein